MNFYTFPATNGFAYSLAAHCEAMATDKQIPLSSFKIFLPTRRGIRTLQEAFLNLSEGKPRLLPIIQSIGDADLEEVSFTTPEAANIPPAIDPLRRQMVLARLLEKLWPHDYQYRQALGIAAELGHLIDQIHTEDLDPSTLGDLKSIRDYAAYWEITTSFLIPLLTEVWPTYLQSEGMIDPGLHRRLRINALTDFYKNNAPSSPVIVAGSTGSIPATRDFIKTIASMDNGQAILPALDMVMAEDSWFKMEDGHPQYLMKILLDYCKIDRKDVTVLSPPTNPDRLMFVSEIMRPQLTTDQWPYLSLPESKETILSGAEGIIVCEAETDHHEATTIALAMLEIAADPDKRKTATLITPDRYLAMRVQSLLRRWGIDIDDSGGTSLTNSAIGQFCLSVLKTLQGGQVQPVPFLAALKNPYAGGGPIDNIRSAVRTLETRLFRGVRPHGDFNALAATCEKEATLLKTLADIFAPLTALQTGMHAMQTLITAHLQVMETLAATTDITGAERLWAGDSGEALAMFFTTMQQQADITPSLSLGDYTEMLEDFLKTQTFTASYGKHPRLSILGQIEARMVQADRVILAGLNEGIWPPDAGFDTWMSRGMRGDFGLPSLEQKTTLAAHDFMAALNAPEVFITRSKKSGGAPTLPSRWLNRMATVLQAAQIMPEHRPHANGSLYTGWAKNLTDSRGYDPVQRPAPCPPLKRRPTEFSVTEIEKWMRDPYWIYARKVLGLYQMDPVDMEVGTADRGTLIHKSIEKFTRIHPRDLPTDAYDALIAIGEAEFAAHAQSPEIHGFWWPRFTKAAAWLIAHERDWRQGTSFINSELTGYLYPEIDGTQFRLKGKADRIESRQDGSYAIIDYKTGSAPTGAEVKSGLTSQLPLEALILTEGGFEKLPPRADAPIALYYWSLSGSQAGGDATLAQGKKEKPDTAQLVAEAKEGLHALLRAYHQQDTAYLGSPDPARMIRTEYNEFAHLERIAEWSVTGDNTEAA